MKIKTWHPGMTDKETADLAYWERNALALHYAEGWYNDDVAPNREQYRISPTGSRYPGWRRVLTLEGGRITFHIPDDFEVGNLPQVAANWDGHTTEEKWERILAQSGVLYEPDWEIQVPAVTITRTQFWGAVNHVTSAPLGHEIRLSYPDIEKLARKLGFE